MFDEIKKGLALICSTLGIMLKFSMFNLFNVATDQHTCEMALKETRLNKNIKQSNYVNSHLFLKNRPFLKKIFFIHHILSIFAL